MSYIQTKSLLSLGLRGNKSAAMTLLNHLDMDTSMPTAVSASFDDERILQDLNRLYEVAFS